MNEQNTLDNWMTNLEKQIKSSNLLDFSFNNVNSIRIMKDDFISLFNDASNGSSFKLCTLESFTSLDQAIASYRINNELKGDELFTNLPKDEQQSILKNLFERYQDNYKKTTATNIYLGFGLLRYSLEAFTNEYKYAPLIFVPLTITYSEVTGLYSIKGVKGEVFANKLLFDRIKKIRRVDLSYPIGTNFSIGDFLYYIGIKTQPLSWNVSNYCFISDFDLSQYDDYLEIKNKKESILNHSIVKKISYFNSQFYSFQERNKKQLDSKYLSVLEMDNDEYTILQRVALRENLFIRANDENAKIHLASNIILSHLMNNTKVLVVYADNEEKELLSNYIENQGYSDYVADLDPLKSNKEDLLADIVNYDKYILPYNKTNLNIVNEDIKKYYNYKNNYKKLFNALRTTQNPLHISINKLVNEYYKLDKYPLLDVTIKDASHLNSDDISRYMEIINAFAKSITTLNCPIEQHPFYGFNKRTMYKADYEKLKCLAIELSTIITDIKTLINLGDKKYGYPIPNTLKEIKALLNVLAFIDEYQFNPEWINNNSLNVYIDELESMKKDILALNYLQGQLVEKHTRKVLFINEELAKEYKQTKSAKAKTKIRRLLSKRLSTIEIDDLIDTLLDFYAKNNEINEKKNTYDQTMIDMLITDNLSILRKAFKQISSFKHSLKYIKNTNDFDINKILHDKNKDRLIHRKAIQNAYNILLKKVSLFQTYFDDELIRFNSLNLDDFLRKVDSMSKNFIAINEYTDFYKSLSDTNDFIHNLGSELIKLGKPEDFKNLFIKRIYFDILNERIISNQVLKENTRKKLYEDLNEFSSSDDKRKEMTKNIISKYIDSYLRINLLNLRRDESDSIYQQFNKGMKIISLPMITKDTKNSLYHLKPCVMTSYKNVSKYLKDPIYQYDCVIILARKNVSIIDALPTLSHSTNTIVFDEEFVSTDPRKTLELKDGEILDDSLITNAKNSYHAYSYTSDNKYIIMQNSRMDHAVKQHVAKILIDHGFDVKLDYPIKSYTLDLVCKIPNTSSVIAIEFNHLPYNSPEDTYRSFELEDKTISDIGFIPYRIFTSSYFFNEEYENSELINFIVKNSNIIPKDKVKKNIIPLMDYLFIKYQDPHIVYYSLDKKNMRLDEIVKTIINECAPISTKELSLLFKENISGIIAKLKKNKSITIEDGFILLPNKQIEFRRIDRSEDYYRPIKYVYKKEIYDAIYKVIKQLTVIESDTLVKMILLSLGYKKMNQENYDFIVSCIEFLINEKIIFINNSKLSLDITVIDD